jgi:citrate lyase beta subunit
MRELALSLAEDPIRFQILLIRIGGNDLLNLLGIRRSRGVTLYETPLAGVISQLITIFRPLGFSLSAPVYEYLADSYTLDHEIRLDMTHGLIGKTAIHPSQIAMIEKHYAVSESDYQEALSILSVESPAVFKMNDAMCEVATHANWAMQILKRHDCYGLHATGFDMHSIVRKSSVA